MKEGDDDGGDLSVPEGFRLVADETRAGILYALSRQRVEDVENPAVRFADLRERVGVRDSGNFSYHLEKLRGRFVQEAEDGEGYVLTYPGHAVVSALLRQEHAATETYGPATYPEPCPLCGGDLEVTYDRGLVLFTCTDDDGHGFQYNLPHHAVDPDDLPAAVELVARRLYADSGLLLDGRCPMCFGEVDLTPMDLAGSSVPSFFAGCSRCGIPYDVAASFAPIHEPPVAAFFAEHGRDLRSSPLELLRLTGEDVVAQLREDPAAFEVTYEIDGDALVATVDDDGAVLSVEGG